MPAVIRLLFTVEEVSQQVLSCLARIKTNVDLKALVLNNNHKYCGNIVLACQHSWESPICGSVFGAGRFLFREPTTLHHVVESRVAEIALI